MLKKKINTLTDKVHVKGIIRERDVMTGKIFRPKGDTKLTYSVYDSRSQVLITTTSVSYYLKGLCTLN